MKKSKFSESQIVAILKEGEAGVALSELTSAEKPWQAGLDAVMAVLGRKMGNTRDQSPELGKLRHTFIHTG